MKQTRETVEIPAPDVSGSETITVRLAASADAEPLRRLAQLDSAPPPQAVPTLVAEIGGELRAALPLNGGRAIADPFRRTAELVAMLATRARQLETRRGAAGQRRPRLMRLLRPVSLPRS
jgi:hypothetical protein